VQRRLLEALSSSLAAQTSHAVPRLSGPVASLAFHYGLDWAGDAAYRRLKKHPKAKAHYDRVFKSKNPKQRPGKFVSDLASIGGTAAGLRAASKVKGGKAAMLAQIAGGVVGHTVGRYLGNKAGNAINLRLYARRRRDKNR
jgi:outer membrane lipoprotein SlyB